MRADWPSRLRLAETPAALTCQRMENPAKNSIQIEERNDVSGIIQMPYERLTLAVQAILLKSDLSEGLGCAYEHLRPLLASDFRSVESKQIFRELMKKFEHWSDKWVKSLKDNRCNGQMQWPLGSMFSVVGGSGKHWLKKKIWELHCSVNGDRNWRSQDDSKYPTP